jgi:hypothetical protein
MKANEDSTPADNPNSVKSVEALEDDTDRDALARAREEDDYVPWDEVKAELERCIREVGRIQDT